jgi:hypothetical protein
MSSKKNPAKKTPAKKNATKARVKRPEAAPEQTTQPDQMAAAPVEQATDQAPMEQAPEADTAASAEKPKAKGRAKQDKPAPKHKKMSAIDAAAKVLADAGQAMNCLEMIEAMAKKGLWTSPGGQTPHATLYSAILREISKKGKESRFTKTERGKFAWNATV